MPLQRGIATIVLSAWAGASPATRRIFWWLMAGSVAMIALQVWDVWDRWGPSGIAELLSVCAAVAGILLLGLVSTIGSASAVFSAAKEDDLRPVLVALPLVAFAGGTLIAAAIAFVIARGLLGIHPGRVIGMTAFLLLGLVFAWITIHEATRVLFDHAERRGRQAARASAELADARVAALQARMQPHFLFNALNTIAALVRSDPDAAEATVEDLSAILRASLKRGDATTWPIREELALVRAFVGVEQRRFGDRLSVAWTIGPGTEDAVVPALSLQPLVENAIKHGIAPRLEGGALSIRLDRADGCVRAIVEDNGAGFSRGWTEGIGLGNLRQRLASLYGGAALLTVEPGPPSRVTMTVPAEGAR